MSTELREALKTAVPRDAGRPDVDAAWHRGRRLRRQRAVRNVGAGIVCAAAIASGVIVAVGDGESRVTVAAAKPTHVDDLVQRFSFDLPTGWHRADDALIKNPGPSEYELLSAGTMQLRQGSGDTRCSGPGELPADALEALGRRDAFIYVIEGLSSDTPRGVETPPVADFRDRPERFEGSPLRVVECVDAVGDAYPNLTFRRVFFQDHDRVIGVHFVWGPNVSSRVQAETYQLLDSLNFEEFPGTRPKTYRDDLNGFTVTVPGDWSPFPASQSELFSISAPEMVAVGCGASSPAVQISVFETPPAGAMPEAEARPDEFGPSSGSIQASDGTVNGCAITDKAQRIVFADAGRFFTVFLHVQPEAATHREEEAYQILNSMQFDPTDGLSRGRPAYAVSVFVLDGNHQAGAIEAAEHQLTGTGYVLIGSRRSPGVMRTSVTCLDRYADDIVPLARALGTSTLTKAPLEHAPKHAKGADCLVTLGQNAPITTTFAPQEIVVLTGNASAQPGAAGVVANRLRGLGYQVLPPFDVPTARSGITIACRNKFGREANTLLAIIGFGGTIEPYSTLVPVAGNSAADADCIVLVGD